MSSSFSLTAVLKKKSLVSRAKMYLHCPPAPSPITLRPMPHCFCTLCFCSSNKLDSHSPSRSLHEFGMRCCDGERFARNHGFVCVDVCLRVWFRVVGSCSARRSRPRSRRSSARLLTLRSDPSQHKNHECGVDSVPVRWREMQVYCGLQKKENFGELSIATATSESLDVLACSFLHPLFKVLALHALLLFCTLDRTLFGSARLIVHCLGHGMASSSCGSTCHERAPACICLDLATEH